jgi:death-on-curing protein
MDERASPFYPTVDDVLDSYTVIMAIPREDADNYVRDLSLLESALNRPKAAAYYEDAGLIEQAASLLWGIAKNHPFTDGNKRTAYVTTTTFLRTNGWTVRAEIDEEYRFMIHVVERLTTQDVAEWIRDRTEPFDR